MVADVSGIAYFAPILSFVIVSAVVFALLKKFELFGKHQLIDALVSISIATIFVTAVSARQLVLNVIPWFVVLLVALFMIIILMNFMGKKDLVGKPLGIAFIILVILVFIMAGIKVYAHTIGPYLPGPYYGSTGDPQILAFTDWIYSPRIIGAVILIIVGGLVSYVLMKIK